MSLKIKNFVKEELIDKRLNPANCDAEIIHKYLALLNILKPAEYKRLIDSCVNSPLIRKMTREAVTARFEDGFDVMGFEELEGVCNALRQATENAARQSLNNHYTSMTWSARMLPAMLQPQAH